MQHPSTSKLARYFFTTAYYVRYSNTIFEHDTYSTPISMHTSDYSTHTDLTTNKLPSTASLSLHTTTTSSLTGSKHNGLSTTSYQHSTTTLLWSSTPSIGLIDTLNSSCKDTLTTTLHPLLTRTQFTLAKANKLVHSKKS